MISNNKVSNLIKTQVPFFVRNDHENFVRFIEAYFEYLEQEDKAVNRIKTSKENMDIDLTIDEFADHMYDTYMKLIPADVIADKKLVMKHIKDFYRAKGTEKAARFLMRILFNEEIEIYYPKKDVIRASDGKWFIQKSLRITDTKVANTADPSFTALNLFIGSRIRGASSNTTAIVERVDRFFEQGTQIDELIISNIDGSFVSGEVVDTEITYNNEETYICANIFGGIINSVTVTEVGSRYQIGDPVIVLSNTGAGACVIVGSVSTGNIASILVDPFTAGAGYRANDYILSVGGGGAGLNAYVSIVDTTELKHPNTYNIYSQTISLEANTLIGNAVYSNLNSSNANVTLSNALSAYTFSNCGPALTIFVNNPGADYVSSPTLSIIGNSAIQQLGILGRMDIVSGGSGYAIGDPIEFINPWGCLGSGATANVTNVDGSGVITAVKFQKMPGHHVGGSGYSQSLLPTANVISGTGTGANIQVTAILASGASLTAANSSIGAIQRLVILSRGAGYETIPTLDLTGSGDGTAQANASIIQGVYSYPGRFLNDDGMISSYNFIEDRDYYQNFSYSVRVKQSISKYRSAFKSLVHPAGVALFGEYATVIQNQDDSLPAESTTEQRIKFVERNYTMNSNVVNVSYSSHGIANGANIYLEYESGGGANVYNGTYQIITTATNWFKVRQNVANSINTSGQVLVGVQLNS